MMNLPTDKVLVVIPKDDPSPIAYVNLYDPGDLWVKIQGCEACTENGWLQCCGRCPFRLEKGCQFHFEAGRPKKPFVCVVDPDPRQARSYCALEYKCMSGPNEGKIRRAQDVKDVLR